MRRTLVAVCALAIMAGQAWARQDEPAPSPGQAANAEPLPAPSGERETELILRDRTRVRGTLVSRSEEQIVLRIQGIETTFKMTQVDAVRDVPSIEEQYALLRAAIADQDVDAILNLARWLRQNERYALADREVDRVLALEPNNGVALELKRQIQAQMAVLANPPGSTPKRPARDRPDTGPDEDASVRDSFPLLTDAQINLIRVFETDLRDPPRMLIRRSTIENFLAKYGGTVVEGRGTVPATEEGREAFLRLRPAEVLSWFFDLRAREFYDEVEVLENPRSMRLFRDNVHRTWLINSCATNRCHGGEEAGRLMLFRGQQASDRSAYTNFLILERFRTAGGLPLIDYNEPARSLLLQYGLPRDKATFKHPDVGGVGRRWAPAFNSQDDQRFREAVQWIQSMFPQRPDYPIEYTPPVPVSLRTPAAPRDARPSSSQPLPNSEPSTGPGKAPDPAAAPGLSPASSPGTPAEGTPTPAPR